jgi:hypothetical protein
MHGVSPQAFAETVSSFLVPYYLALAAMNGIFAYYCWTRSEKKPFFSVPMPGFTLSFTPALLWTIVSVVFVFLASLAAGANLSSMPQMPQAFRDFANASSRATIYSLGTTAVLVVLYLGRAWFVKPTVAWSIWNLMLLFLALSMPDPNFYAIVAKPDNVPRSSPGSPRIEPSKTTDAWKKVCRPSKSSTTKRCSSGRTSSIPK